MPILLPRKPEAQLYLRLQKNLRLLQHQRPLHRLQYRLQYILLSQAPSRLLSQLRKSHLLLSMCRQDLSNRRRNSRGLPRASMCLTLRTLHGRPIFAHTRFLYVSCSCYLARNECGRRYIEGPKNCEATNEDFDKYFAALTSEERQVCDIAYRFRVASQFGSCLQPGI